MKRFMFVLTVLALSAFTGTALADGGPPVTIGPAPLPDTISAHFPKSSAPAVRLTGTRCRIRVDYWLLSSSRVHVKASAQGWCASTLVDSLSWHNVVRVGRYTVASYGIKGDIQVALPVVHLNYRTKYGEAEICKISFNLSSKVRRGHHFCTGW